MMGAEPNLRRKAAAALFWSLVQTWGSRFLSIITFLALARFLSPEEFGLAASAILIFSVTALVSELGIGDALIRNRHLPDAELNAPFFAALGAAVVASSLMALASSHIERLLGVPGLAPFVICAAALVPISVAAGFQEAVMKRDMQFQRLAIRTLTAGTIGGFVGLALGIEGYGAWAMMGLFASQILVGAAWLWFRPAWRPGLTLGLDGFRSIGFFGLNLMGMRIVDFAAMRTVDVIVLTQLRASTFGLFALSWRFYQLLMQLFQASLGSVGLAMLSHIQDDPARMGRVFVRGLSISAMLASPFFFLAASATPELTHLLLGPRWLGTESIMSALLVVGSVHCVIFSAGSFLTALGRPHVLLRLMLLKAALVLVPLLVLRPDDPAGAALVIASGLLAEAPFTIHATLRALDLPWSALKRSVLVPIGGAGMAALATLLFRQSGIMESAAPLPMLLAVSLVFTSAYGTFLAATSFAIAKANVSYMLGAFNRG